ncbi:hypothetical protein BE221DRAFT_194847 [Ostreococcus tauri]|uniref:Uncharacterized protein n=1 Tax=Ostreococcus tauri TaxID=70448 RepID=A0A1Y5I8S5_OSTTA|nr:hypothetical protein BE221DRAFT_194847 [Ostreococcus tauri]
MASASPTRETKRRRRSSGTGGDDDVVDARDGRPRDGARLEVQWEVRAETSDDDACGATTLTWWPCVVREDDGGTFLTYAARDGFESETRGVTFADGGSRRRLTHDDEGGIFRWRFEGEEDEGDEGEGEEVVDDAPTTMGEILRAQEAMDAAHGESVENASMAAFATLPMNQQMNLASAFATFKEKLLGKLNSLVAQKGDDVIVTKDDIDNIMGDIAK